MHKNKDSDELMDQLGHLLAIPMSVSKETRWNDEQLKRDILLSAIAHLEAAYKKNHPTKKGD